MVVPTFVGIGVPRAGTTWLHELLASHRDVYMPKRRKELSFFDLHYDRGAGWYRKFFPSEREVSRYRAIGEITPYYYYCADCPQRMASLGVEKLVLVLRNPVDRAWSYYAQKIRNGMYRGSFEDFLGQSKWAVIDQGQYSRYLRRYLEHFEQHQILVLVFERALADVEGTKQALASFLGISDSGFAREVQEPVNSSYMPRARRLYGLAFRASKVFRHYDLDWVVNLAKRMGVREAFGAIGKVPPMREETRSRLEELFLADILELENLLQVTLDPWKQRAVAQQDASS
jgi:hypothetical protein